MAIPQDILLTYERKQDAALRQLAAHRAEVAARLPEYGELETQITTLLATQGRAALENPQHIAQQAVQTTAAVARLREAQQAVLVAANYPKDYLQPHYQCPICQDTGFTGTLEPCACLLQTLAAHVMRDVAPQMLVENFEHFDLLRFPEMQLQEVPNHTQRSYMQLARDYCLRYAETLPQPEKSHLILTGNAGTGKTFLCNCIAKRAIDRRLTVLMLPYYLFVERLLQDRSVKATALATDVLILDDLGSEPMLNNITVETLHQLFNERSRFGKPIVLSTNLSPTDMLKRYTERVVSRMFNRDISHVLPLYGRDIRLENPTGGMSK